MSVPQSETAQTGLQDTISQQRAAISELQTPVIEVWDGILALPIIGSVDTARAQEMNEALLERIVATGAWQGSRSVRVSLCARSQCGRSPVATVTARTPAVQNR